MREGNYRRKLDKKLDTIARDMEGGTGNARSLHKAVTAYGKALIDDALDNMAQDEAEEMDPCVMCGQPCVGLCCSNTCEKEAVNIGLFKRSDKFYS